jgi:hypothetical protein
VFSKGEKLHIMDIGMVDTGIAILAEQSIKIAPLFLIRYVEEHPLGFKNEARSVIGVEDSLQIVGIECGAIVTHEVTKYFILLCFGWYGLCHLGHLT